MATARIYSVQVPGEVEFYIEATGHTNVRDYLTKDTKIKLATRAELTALLGSGRKIASAIEVDQPETLPMPLSEPGSESET